MSAKRIGILGCGGFAGAHARRLKAVPEVQIAALADVSGEKIQGLIQRRLQEYTPAPDGNFVDVLYGRAEPICAVQDGLRMAQLMDALYESARTGRPQKR